VRRTFPPDIEIALSTAEGRAQVTGDPAQLEQVVMNLLVNARDALASGGGRIAIDLGVDRGAVTLIVEDTGPGVPVELRERIFEPYFTTKVDRESPGTGLGLATVYGVIQSHGGTIEVGDARPQGARFRITLPAASAQAVMIPSPEQDELVRGAGVVLVVDDEDQVRGAVRRALEMLGYGVIEARDGVEAVAAFKVHAAALRAVVLDALMPRLGGRAALAEMQAIRPEVPVVMISGRIRPGEAAELLALGARGLLPKPFDIAALSSTLARALSG